MGSWIWMSVSIMFAIACSSRTSRSTTLPAPATHPSREIQASELVDSAGKKLSEAFLLFRQAADSGHLPAIAYVAKAYEYGIGVENELSALSEGAYLYNSIGAALAAGSGQGEEFQAKATRYENGRSAKEVASMRKRVAQWFDSRPGLKAKTGKAGHEH